MTREPDPLGAAIRRAQDGADTGEARARAAFRAARNTAGYAARRTRRRDDWRPVPVRGRFRGSLRTTALGVAATVLLGGVAVAASGTLDPGAPAQAPVRGNPDTPEASPPTSAAPTEVGGAPRAVRGAETGRTRTEAPSKGKIKIKVKVKGGVRSTTSKSGAEAAAGSTPKGTVVGAKRPEPKRPEPKGGAGRPRDFSVATGGRPATRPSRVPSVGAVSEETAPLFSARDSESTSHR
ncbi:hypothetical protein ACFYV5_29080 [Streptomyces sp. NPDC003035]|uniref:hypothetical protein n=1 Tax=Streptomyces sp. NPDC003035 TaxID=3364676 RepID=UPI0036CF3301